MQSSDPSAGSAGLPVMNWLMTVWHPGGHAPLRPSSSQSDGTLVHRYRVDESAEDMTWVESSDGRRNIFGDEVLSGAEIFTFDLARDVGSGKTPAAWLYIVHTDIPDDVVGDYNAWYDNEHLPRLVTVPGVERARRYIAHGALSPRYLTAYDLSIKDAFESPEGLKARKTPWTEKMRALFKNTRRKMCALQP